ncbi:MAG TPA: NAD(P)(+) transhydrogenase (Re/Si-specific) subunit beta, partial [Verrucomicrobiae bacterium]|nr:NAD(P)(+) transhydrogenase (Re/Si-specific) subunit beta [Verrucomicrobiae bacterium]
MNRATELIYIVCAALFIAGLKLLSSPRTARRGNLFSALGMLLAVATTLLDQGILDFKWIVVGLAAGGVIGAVLARRVAMTAMPEMVALLNGFGGLASLLVAADAYLNARDFHPFTTLTLFLSVWIGGVTFTGSMVAWGKLSETLPGRALLFPGQKLLNGLLLAATLAGAIRFATIPQADHVLFASLVGLAGLLGVLVVVPIGGADMPVVISLLNSYSGMAACATGFLLGNSVLIVTGSLVGASGFILTRLMCKAMNRSLANVLFGGLGATGGPAVSVRSAPGETKPISVADAYVLLEAARLVAIVPGYGLAVAQAQHVARELSDLLEKNGTEVRFAIHPVAGRMPGHMNVLLAEANVPYEQLVEMNSINAEMERVDVCLVIGANDVVNPAAREDPASPIYGMPIIEADRART